MQPSNPGRGVVQWVNPRPAKTKRAPSKERSQLRSPKIDSSNQLHSSHNNSTNYSDIMILGPSDSENESENDIGIDTATCKTLCMIVEAHLKELGEHQKSINLARSRLANGNYDDQDRVEDHNFISYCDISRLKVRDEQTKAIETIKQLTNYLRELSFLRRLENEAENQPTVDLETIHRLSDVRINIVQALNDFVLMNSDIDVPIVDGDDTSYREYDLCFDAQSSLQKSSVNVLQDSVNTPRVDGKTEFLINSDRPSIVIVDIANPEQQQRSRQSQLLRQEARLPGIQERKRELQKLEKDTVELRQLFSEFYNLVKQQSEPIDTIEDNIVIATQRISEGQNNINKTMRTLTVLVPFTGCMAGALIGGPLGFFVGGKLGGVTIICASSLLGLVSSYGAQRCIISNKIKRD